MPQCTQEECILPYREACRINPVVEALNKVVIRASLFYYPGGVIVLKMTPMLNSKNDKTVVNMLK